MRALAIATVTLRRTLRNRTTVVISFVMPFMLILVLGLTFGGSQSALIGVVSTGSGRLGTDLLHSLENTSHIQVVERSDLDAMKTDVERGKLDAGIVIPDGYDAALRAGQPETVTYFAKPGPFTQQLGEALQQAVANQSLSVGAAQFAVARGGASSFDGAYSLANQVALSSPSVSVTQTTVGQVGPFNNVTIYDEGSWSQLLLFVFITALTGGAFGLIEAKRLGIIQRMIATPTSSASIIAGFIAGRVLVAIVQSLVIIAGSALFFGVRWGNPLGTAAVIILFALVAAGAGLLLGTLIRNEQQTQGITLLLGLGLAAIGGCMFPLELFPPTMKAIAHLTPHAWANDAFLQLIGNGANVLQIAPQLGVIALYAAVLLGLSGFRLRQALTA